METSTDALQGQTWEGRSVDLDDIERELNRLWRETTAKAGANADASRANVLNLVVYTTSDADAEALYATVGKLAGRHPMRAIILSAEPHHAEPSLNTRIQTYCPDEPSGGAQPCCEQVLIEANGEPANHLSSVVLPLLVPDLPLYTWWMGEPDDASRTFAELIRPTNKLILDSSSYQPSGDILRRVLEISRGRDGVCAVADLAWVRLWRWFDAIAEFFDEPALRAHLSGIAHVSVEYAAPSGGASTSQAAMLVGWLFSRLGQQPGAVELAPVSADLPAGSVVAFRMETRHGADTALFEVRLKEGNPASGQASARVNDRVLAERPAHVAPRADAEILDIVLEGCERDMPYEESLEIAAHLLDRGGSR